MDVLILGNQSFSVKNSNAIGALKLFDTLKCKAVLMRVTCLEILKNMLKYYTERRNPWLSQRIKIEKVNSLKGKHNLKKPGIRLHQPSLKSFFIILLIFFLLFIASQWFNSLTDVIAYILSYWTTIDPLDIPVFVTTDQGHYQNLIAVLAGIGAIVFALMIFIAESFRDGSPDKGRVLLKESLIWPLTVSLILTFLMFLWGDYNHLIVLPIICVALLTIYSLGRVISILTNRVKFTEKRREFLKDTILQSVNLAVESRLADNIFLSKLNSNSFPLEYHPLTLDNAEEFVLLKSSEYGQIKDINLHKLEEFAKKLERAALKNGYSFKPTRERVDQSLEENDSISAAGNTHLIKNTNRYVLKRYNESVNESQSTLICYDERLTEGNESVQEELARLAGGIFKIGKLENFSDEARSEIENIRDAFAKSITNQTSGEVKEYSITFIALAEAFLDEISKFGGGYTYDQARKEITSLFSGWNEVRWLTDDLRELLEMAVNSKNKDILGTVAYTPIAIARRAMDRHDHYIFQEFIRFAELLYIFTYDMDESDLKKYLIDRSWRYLNELCRFQIVHSLSQDSVDVDMVYSYRDFAIHILQTYQNLLKCTFEREDFDTFKKYKYEVNNLFKDFKVQRWSNEAKRLKFSLDNTHDERQKRALEKKHSLARARGKLIEAIESRKDQMLFGVSAFILDKYRELKDNDQLQKFYNESITILPNDIRKLAELFAECHTFETEDFWNWSWWDMKSGEGLQEIQVLEKLEVLFAVKGLHILSSLSQNQIDGISLPTSRDLVYLVDGSRELMNTLNDIENNPEEWDGIVDQSGSDKVNAFKRLLHDAKDRQEEKERVEILKTPISPIKVKQFKDGVLSSFKDREKLTSIFKFYDCYKNNSQKPPYSNMVRRLGVNTVDDKAAFFESWFVHYGDYGESYGINLASGIDSEILSKMIERASVLDFYELDSYLDSFGSVKDIIIITTDVQTELIFNDTGRFTPHWHPDIQKVKEQDIAGFYGYYKHREKSIPVFEVFEPGYASQLLVINTTKFATYVQDPPIDKGESFDKVKDILYIDVATFSESAELLEELIKSPPEWLKKIGDRNAQISHLLQMVNIRIYIRFHMEWDANADVKKIVIEENAT